MLRTFLSACFLMSSVALPTHVVAADQSAAAPTFEKHIRPILKAHCFQCHGELGEREGKLDVRLRRLIAKGGETGPAIVPGKPAASLLLKRVASGEMPPGEKHLSKKDVETIRRWIAAGAKTARPEPKQIGDDPIITPEERAFWSFQPIRRYPVPKVEAADRVRTPIDAFLLRKLEEKNLTFSPDADRRTLIRRLTFDLHGLPPTPEQIAAFLADTRPNAYERLVDQLLSSPRYGERWARHWLDIAGYADSEGFSATDTERPWAYKYRDYVVRSLNNDKPFDRFLREQIAGDEMVPLPYKNLKPAEIDRLVATGFLRMAPDGTGTGGVNQTEARNQVIADTLKIVSTSVMGLSVGCAQCHDHRYDPIPQTDYYRMRAIFEPAYDWKNWRTPAGRRISLYTDADRKEAARIEAEAKNIDAERLKKQAEYIERTFQKELAKLPEKIRETVRVARNTPVKKRTAEQKTLLRNYPSVNVSAGSLYLYDRKAANDLKARAAEAAKVRATKPKEEFIRAMTEQPGKVPATKLFFRGDPKQPRQTMAPASLTVLNSKPIPANQKTLPTTGRRKTFAEHLTSGRHPLTARVLVNRIWLHHFGSGIVGTPADFGRLGERPTHPQLLDWLASEFMTPESPAAAGKGWSMKHIHRLILTSTAYRQQSQRRPELDSRDPDNRLYGRKSIQRLDAESLRDALLSISGRYNEKLYGPPVPVMEDAVGRFVVGKENKNGENRPGKVIPLDGNEYRRSLYVQVRRTRPLSVLSTFDAPVMEPNCEMRNSSTVTPQSLMLMNGDYVIARANDLAKRLMRHTAKPDKQIEQAYQLVFGRRPSQRESRTALDFYNSQHTYFRSNAAKSKAKDKTAPAELALASFCQALFSSNEFLYASSKVFHSPWKFRKHGETGTDVSELLPHFSKIVDDVTLIRSMHTGVNNHGQSINALNTGRIQKGRPTLGSWMTYGLGNESQNLPAYVALTDPAGLPVLGVDNWSNGWLPALFQGTVVRPREPRILNLNAPTQFAGEAQQRYLSFVDKLNREHLRKHPGELDLEARISSYELAAKMQSAAKEALDVTKETKATHKLYGMDQEATKEYGTRCLIARRLIERGVRFVQVFTRYQFWDHHGNIRNSLPRSCQKVDQPSAALVQDLKQRGLLDSTVVHWGGEMGRLPVIQNEKNIGRDHNTYGFSSWFAGGGFRRGYVHGATDDFGHHAVKDVFNHYDYHRTLLHLFGLDPEKLVFRRNNRDQSLLDGQPGAIVKSVLEGAS
eukprot:g21886.t1